MKTKTLLIQGPLCHTSLGSIFEDDHINKFDQIVISHWVDDEIDERIEGYLKRLEQHDHVVFVRSPLPDMKYKMDPLLGPPVNDGTKPYPPTNHCMLEETTFWYAIVSTMMGLQQATVEITVKQRSDERYENFDPLINTHFETGAWSCPTGNIFYKPVSEYLFHIGDHVFCSRTKNLMKTYYFMFAEYTCFPHSKHNFMILDSSRAPRFGLEECGFPTCAESVLCNSYLHANGLDWNNWTNVFPVVDINLLGDYHVHWKHMKIDWRSPGHPLLWRVTNSDQVRDAEYQIIKRKSTGSHDPTLDHGPKGAS